MFPLKLFFFVIFTFDFSSARNPVCQGPKTVPIKQHDQPGTYNVFIVYRKVCLNSCNDQVHINNDQLTYAKLTDAIPDYFGFPNPQINAIDIFVGAYAPCERKFDKKYLTAALKLITKHIETAKPNILRLNNVPEQNFEIVNAAKNSVTLVVLTDCDKNSLNASLRAVEGCSKLRTLLIQGSVKFQSIWNALYGKPSLRQIHIEQDSGYMSEHGFAHLFESLPKLNSAILKCTGKCRTSFKALIGLATKTFETMRLVSLENTGRIDAAGLRISKSLGKNVRALLLRGEQPIRCNNFVDIVSNLMKIKDNAAKNPNGNIYFTAEHDCGKIEKVWRKVEEKHYLKLEKCPVHLESCRFHSASNTAVLIQKFLL